MSGADPVSLDRTSPPGPGPIRPFHLPPTWSHALGNGLRLRAVGRISIPLVSGCLVLEAGEATLEDVRGGLAVLTGDALQGGTGSRSGVELAEALENLGTSLRISTGWDATTVAFTCLAERLNEVMALLAEVVRTPTFPDDEVDRIRRQRLAAIRQRRMDPGHLADDELDREVFPAGHPYARSLAGEVEAVEGVTRDEVAGYSRERYRPGGGGFVLVGDLSPDQVEAAVAAELGDWEGKAPLPFDLPAVEPRTPRRVLLVHRPGSVQSEIRIGQPGPPRGVEDEDALRVANSVLGGAFTSRLNLNLRERHGFTYGVRSSVVQRRRGGQISIGTAVGTEVTGPALREAMGEFRRFQAEGPTAEEVGQARDYLAGVFPLRMETTAQLAARMAELLIFDLPDDYHHTYRERIRAVTPERAVKAAERHYRPEEAAVVIVGDAGQIRDEVEALDLGPVEVKES
jgi:zinc protease